MESGHGSSLRANAKSPLPGTLIVDGRIRYLIEKMLKAVYQNIHTFELIFNSIKQPYFKAYGIAERICSFKSIGQFEYKGGLMERLVIFISILNRVKKCRQWEKTGDEDSKVELEFEDFYFKDEVKNEETMLSFLSEIENIEKEIALLKDSLDDNDVLILSYLEEIQGRNGNEKDPLYKSLKGSFCLIQNGMKSDNDEFPAIIENFKQRMDLNVKLKSKIKYLKEESSDVFREYLQSDESDEEEVTTGSVEKLFDREVESVKYDRRARKHMGSLACIWKVQVKILARIFRKLNRYYGQIYQVLGMVKRRGDRIRIFEKVSGSGNKGGMSSVLKLLRTRVIKEISDTLELYEDKIIAISERIDSEQCRIAGVKQRFKERREVFDELKRRFDGAVKRKRAVDLKLEVCQRFKKVKLSEELGIKADALTRDKDELSVELKGHREAERMYSELFIRDKMDDIFRLRRLRYEIVMTNLMAKEVYIDFVPICCAFAGLLNELSGYYAFEGGQRAGEGKKDELLALRLNVTRRMKCIMDKPLTLSVKTGFFVLEGGLDRVLEDLNENYRHYKMLMSSRLFGDKGPVPNEGHFTLYKNDIHGDACHLVTEDRGYDPAETARLKKEFTERRAEVDAILGQAGKRPINFSTSRLRFSRYEFLFLEKAQLFTLNVSIYVIQRLLCFEKSFVETMLSKKYAKSGSTDPALELSPIPQVDTQHSTSTL